MLLRRLAVADTFEIVDAPYEKAKARKRVSNFAQFLCRYTPKLCWGCKKPKFLQNNANMRSTKFEITYGVFIFIVTKNETLVYVEAADM